MKKVLVFLMVCLASTSLFAQSQDPYYVPIEAPGFPGIQMTINASIFIDGVEQHNMNLELGVFCAENGECRATKFPPRELPNGTIYYQGLMVKGQTGEHYIYKVYDHENNRELECETVFTDDYPQLTFASQQTYGALRAPWHVYLVTTGPASQTFTKDIAGYGEGNGNWYLIASPLADNTDPTDVENMIDADGNYDLYWFDQAQANEWINYKDEEHGGGFSLANGKGYLYANMTDVTLTFTGVPGTNGEVTLNNYPDAGFPGWNLVGNPLGDTAYIDREFYTMNEERTELMVTPTSGRIEPMEGIFVHAQEDGEAMTFTTTPPEAKGSLALNLSNGRAVIDRAIVNFGEGSQLPKFQLRESNTKVYIPQDGSDYAVVNAEEMGEMPVSFKAESNGSYMLSFNAENVSFNYLHLIDNMTGADVDLLATPSYSFDALTTDYASRFRLVFATGNADEDNFAFFSDGNLIISNEGNATVQVIDVNGRILSSKTINGSASINVSGAAGVYMIRLVNGENVRVQKVVVR